MLPGSAGEEFGRQGSWMDWRGHEGLQDARVGRVDRGGLSHPGWIGAPPYLSYSYLQSWRL